AAATVRRDAAQPLHASAETAGRGPPPSTPRRRRSSAEPAAPPIHRADQRGSAFHATYETPPAPRLRAFRHASSIRASAPASGRGKNSAADSRPRMAKLAGPASGGAISLSPGRAVEEW